MATRGNEPLHEPRPRGDLEHLVSVLSQRWVLGLATRDAAGAPYVTPLYFALWNSPWIGDLGEGVAEPLWQQEGGPTEPATSRARATSARVRPPVLIFASNPRSAHGEHLGAGPTSVAGAVAWETEDVASLRGVQLRGVVVREDRLPPAAYATARSEYLRRHPVAERMLARGGASLFVLRLIWAKLTDNRLGIGVHPVFQFPASEADEAGVDGGVDGLG